MHPILNAIRRVAQGQQASLQLPPQWKSAPGPRNGNHISTLGRVKSGCGTARQRNTIGRRNANGNHISTLCRVAFGCGTPRQNKSIGHLKATAASKSKVSLIRTPTVAVATSRSSSGELTLPGRKRRATTARNSNGSLRLTPSSSSSRAGLGSGRARHDTKKQTPRYASSCRRVVSVGRCSIVTKTKSLHHLIISKPAALPQVSSS